MDELMENQELPKKKVKIWQVIIAVVACLALLVGLAAVVVCSVLGITDLKDLFGGKDNSTATTAPTTKPSQGPSKEELLANREQVVATMGDATLTNGQLQIYYWTSVIDFLKQNGNYIFYLGLDITKPLSEQPCYLDEYETWQDFFVQDALDDWHKYQSMALEAQKAGLTLPEDLQKTLDELETTMTEKAKEYGFDSAEALVQNDYGQGCTFEDYHSYMLVYFTGYNYFNEQIKQVKINEQVLSDYYDANAEDLLKKGFKKDDSKVYAVRHILISVEGTTGDDGKITVTDTDWEICRQKAEVILNEWLDGEHTEETFAEFANKYSDDKEGNVTDGGIYSGLDENTNFVTPFKEWYLDESNQVGAYGLVKSTYGYHIMYQSSIAIKWQAECENRIYAEKTAEVLEEVTKLHPISIDAGKVLIGAVDFTA